MVGKTQIEFPELEPDWENDEYLQRWLKGRNEGTQKNYRASFRRFVEFTKMTPEEMVLEKWNDLQDTEKKPWEKMSAEERVKEFHAWLIERGKAPKTAKTICGAILNFYAKQNLPLSIKLKDFVKGAAPLALNQSEKMSAEQIEKLAYHAKGRRDKAYIWIAFQSGLDVSTVLSLNWGHIEKEFDDPPMGAIMLRNVERQKVPGTFFNTFIYRTAIRHLKAYLRKRFGDDILDPEKRQRLIREKKLEWDTPLFVVSKGTAKGKRLEPRWIQEALKEIAPDTNLVGTRLAKANINPLRPHAMRASFSDQMAKAGANKILVDYLMGHKMVYDTAYFGGEEGLREAYVRYAQLVLEPKRVKAPGEIEKALRTEIEGLRLAIEGLRQEKDITEAKLNKYIENQKQFMQEYSWFFERLDEEARRRKIEEDVEDIDRQREEELEEIFEEKKEK